TTMSAAVGAMVTTSAEKAHKNLDNHNFIYYMRCLGVLCQLKASDYESGGQEFESLRARHFGIRYRRRMPPLLRLIAPAGPCALERSRRRVLTVPTRPFVGLRSKNLVALHQPAQRQPRKRGCPRLFSFPQPRGLSGGGPCGHAVRNQLRELLRRAVERFEAWPRELAAHVLGLERCPGSGRKFLDHGGRPGGGGHQSPPKRGGGNGAPRLSGGTEGSAAW